LFIATELFFGTFTDDPVVQATRINSRAPRDGVGELVTFLKIILSSLIMAGVIYILPNIQLVIIIPIAMVGYGLGLIVTKAISKKTILEIISTPKIS